MPRKKHPLALLFGCLVLAGLGSLGATAQEKVRFAVGPFQPSASDTRKAYEPFFNYLADRLGRPYELAVTTDWAGISIALSTKQADIA